MIYIDPVCTTSHSRWCKLHFPCHKVRCSCNVRIPPYNSRRKCCPRRLQKNRRMEVTWEIIYAWEGTRVAKMVLMAINIRSKLLYKFNCLAFAHTMLKKRCPSLCFDSDCRHFRAQFDMTKFTHELHDVDYSMVLSLLFKLYSSDMLATIMRELSISANIPLLHHCCYITTCNALCENGLGHV